MGTRSPIGMAILRGGEIAGPGQVCRSIYLVKIKRLSRGQNGYGKDADCTRWDVHWHDMAKPIEPSVCCGDAALCQIALTTFLLPRDAYSTHMNSAMVYGPSFSSLIISSWFSAHRLPSAYHTLCCKGILVGLSPKIRVLPSGTLFR